jgi:type IV pilus assembly protein PilQ
MRIVMTKFGRLAGVVVLAAAVLAAGCAGGPAAEVKRREAAQHIVDFLIVDEDARLTVLIRGDRPLTHTAAKTETPPEVVCLFPEADLDRLPDIFYPPANAVVKALRAEAAGLGTRVRIELHRDYPYTVLPAENDLKIVFTKPAAGKAKGQPAKPPAASAKPPAAAPASGTLKAVTAAPRPEGVLIRVEMTGTAKTIKTLRTENPATYVIDLFGAGSAFKGEQRVRVDSPFVTAVRHFAYPDKVRVVVETTRAYLDSCAVAQVPGGLIVNVGRPEADLPKADSPLPGKGN